MKRAAFFLLPCFLLIVAGCTLYPARAEIRGQTSLDFGRVRKVLVETANGHVRIKCDPDATSLGAQFTKFSRGLTEEDARQSASTIEVEAGRDGQSPDILRLAARIPAELFGRSAGVHFDMEMPPGADVEVHTRNGEIRLAGAEGAVELKTSNGRVEIERIQGSAIVKTSNGPIVAKDVRGSLDLESRNGAIELDQIDGETIHAVTSNGHIKAEGIDGEPSLKTSNGSITLKVLSLPSSPRVKALSSNGPVRVEVPASVNARLSLSTSNGRIDRRLDNAAVSELEVSRRRVDAVLNGGGGEIEVATSNGTIIFEITGGEGH
jgi:DUF4097 and DUF4098 domain-containing protein YvlB